MNPKMRTIIVAGITFVLLALTAQPAEALARRYRHSHSRVATRLNIVITPGRAPGRPDRVVGRATGAIDFNIEPEESAVFVDGTYRGTADDLDGFPTKLYLPAGLHRITVKTPSGIVWSETIRVLPGREINLNTRLED